MFKKVLLFFLIASCAVQNLEARSTDIGERTIIDVVKELIEKLKDALGSIPAIIQDIRNKIKEIIQGLNIDKIVEQIQEKINKILKDLGVLASDVKDCIDTEKEAVRNLITSAQEGIAACKKEADDKLENSLSGLEKLKNAAKQLVDNGIAIFDKCVKEHGIEIIGLIRCLKDNAKSFVEDAQNLVATIAETVKETTELAIDVTSSLTKCVAALNNKIIKEQKDIIEQFTTCVKNHE